MKSSLDEFVSVIDRLITRLDELEARVSALEHQTAIPHERPTAAAAAATEPSHPLAQLSGSSRLLPALGRVFLGIAGAYVLRALAESGYVPHWAIAALGLVYVLMWLVQAARSSQQNTMVGAAYAVTAGVIFSPMLWELTLRFKLISTTGAAVVLAAFAGVAAALGWKRKLAGLATAPAIFAVVLAIALFVTARAPVPYTVALIVLALMMEIAAHAGRWPGLRILPAIFTDLALVALIAIYVGRGVPPEYPPIAPAVLLALFAAPFILYALSTMLRTVVLRREIGIFDIGQTVAAFLLGGFGGIGLADGSAARVIGIFCLVAAAGCYLLVFTRFERAHQSRNYHVFSAWAAGFLLAGSMLLFSEATAVAILGTAAVAAALAGLRSARLALAVHGVFYVAASLVLSGLLSGFGKLLIGDAPQPLAWAAWMTGAFALVCYAFTWQRFPEQPIQFGPRWPQQVLRLAFAVPVVSTFMALALMGGLATLGTLNPARLAGLRTLVLCAAAIVLGWIGPRFSRRELVWLAYAAIAFCTLKLLFEDMRAGSAAAIAFSLACYGICWVVVPRFARSARA